MNLELFIAKRLSFGKARSFINSIIRLAIAGIAIGVAVMIISSAIIRGFKNQITEKIFGFWGTIHITDVQVNNTNEPIPILKSDSIVAQIEEIGQLSYQVPKSIMGNEIDAFETQLTKGGVSHVQAFALASGIIKTKDYLEGVVLKGVDEDFDWEVMRDFLVRGELLDVSGDKPLKEILISNITSNRLNLDLGDKLIVQFIKDGRQVKKAFKVKGIYKSGLEEYDRRIAIVDIKKIQEVNNWNRDQIGGYEVLIDDISDMEIISHHIYREILPSRLTARTIKEKFPSIFEWLELQKLNEWVIMGLMILVCMINMITALLILILERSKMIGILKSMGSSNWSVRKLFLYQGAIIIIYGLLFGNVIGIGLAYLQKKTGFIKLDEKNYYLSEAPIEFDLDALIMINFGSFILVMLSLIIPTYVISKITPVKVLRFQ